MKLTAEVYELIIDLLEAEYNNTEDKKYKKLIKEALSQVDYLGIY